MNKTLAGTAFMLLAAASLAFGQKGIDTQTQKIKEDANKATARPSDTGRSFDWGKGKTVVPERLPNPIKLNSRRDVLIATITEILREKKVLVDEGLSRPADGILITQPFVFARGPVTARSELMRYGVIDFADTAWSRGQYTLVIEVQSIDGIQNNVSVNAKVEGRSGAGLTSEWTTVPSSGLAEDEFLAKLVETVTGTSRDVQEPVDK